MGKGQIVSGGTDGQYQVQIKYNRDRYDTTIAALNTKKDELVKNRVPVQTDYDDKSLEVDSAVLELGQLIDELADLFEDLEALQSQLAALRHDLAILEQELADLINQVPPAPPEDIEAKREAIADKKIEISDKQTEISDKQKEIKEKQTEIEEKQKEVNSLSFELAILFQQLAGIDLQITSIEKKTQYLEENMPADETVGAWCADLTEDLSGNVGTIEIPGERIGDYGGLQIQPGYGDNAAYDQDRDGQLFPAIAVTPSQSFYNAAMLPGWQKWKPLFRHGTITAIADGLASVTLDVTVKSSQQDLAINQAATLSEVQFEYMDCDDTAFSVDDNVLIMFTDQDFTKPKIIGFKETPKTCCVYAERFTDLSYDLSWVIIGDESQLSFFERETYGKPDDQFYLAMDCTSLAAFVDDRWNADIELSGVISEHHNATVHINLGEMDFWNDAKGWFMLQVYAGPPEGQGDLFADVIFKFFSPGLAKDYWDHLMVDDNIVVVDLEDIDQEEDGTWQIDLSEEPYHSVLDFYGSILGFRFEVFKANIEVNSIKLCANHGAEPILPLPL